MVFKWQRKLSLQNLIKLFSLYLGKVGTLAEKQDLSSQVHEPQWNIKILELVSYSWFRWLQIKFGILPISRAKRKAAWGKRIFSQASEKAKFLLLLRQHSTIFYHFKQFSPHSYLCHLAVYSSWFLFTFALAVFAACKRNTYTSSVWDLVMFSSFYTFSFETSHPTCAVI